jgi:hypothetical protein
MQVIYVPNPQSSGLDTFSYSANDCPVNVQVGIYSSCVYDSHLIFSVQFASAVVCCVVSAVVSELS